MVATSSQPVIQGPCDGFMKYMPGIATRTTFSLFLTIGLAVAQSPPTRPLADPTTRLEDGLLRWPVSPADAAYTAIDGRHLHAVVEDFAAIARRYRDAGHPQYWGRIVGTSADEESAAYLVRRFQQIGLTDVRRQPFDLPPQWMPRSWEMTATAADRTVKLSATQPAYATPATPANGLEAEVVWLGTGTEADYIDRNVTGKAVVITRGAQTNLRLAEARGAVALLLVNAMPGNVRNQVYPLGTKVPTFTIGMNDGIVLRDLIARAGGERSRIRIRLDATFVPGLKTATVWGTLPGATDETIYVLAHRDGWFEGASDNASGVATMVGLAEYFAKIPPAQRRRTMVFLGSAGHHNSTETTGHATAHTNVSGTWLVDNRATLFAKTALFINAEHTSTLSTFVQLGQNRVRRINTYTGMLWYAGGVGRPKLQDIAAQAFRDFGVSTYAEPETAPPNGEADGLWPHAPIVQLSDYNLFFHTEEDRATYVPWTGLEATTRAYAKIIDRVNGLDLDELQARK
jgi:hypothetical protein